MKDKYKSYIDQIHAPQNLIEDTINKVNKQNKSAAKNKRKSFYTYIAAGAAAAVIIISVNVNFMKNSVVYTPISQTMIRNINHDNEYTAMSREDYEKYIGINLESLFKEQHIDESSINVVMGADKVTPVYDEALFNFSDDGNFIMMKLSKNEDVAPQELSDAPQSKCGNYEVHFGIDNSGNKCYASGKLKGVNYFIIADGVKKKEFPKKVEKYLNNMKPF